jgi:hypothetical protein
MSKLLAYDPQQGCKYQIFCKNPEYGRVWEHCDYAKDTKEKDYLIGNYKQAYGNGWQFKSILLPQKYWK